MDSLQRPNCPACQTSELITISMIVAATKLAFSTCHQCEAKWWVRDGEQVALSSVLGTVATR